MVFMHNLTVYRICKNEFINDLSGAGAKLYGGRWNAVGMPAVYTSGSIALALLEILCYIPMQLIKNNYSIAAITIKNADIKDILPNHLPHNWQQNKDVCQQVAQQIFLNSNYHVIKVPSAVIGQECNFVVNPNAKDLNITISEIWPLTLDLRLQNQS